MYDYAAYLSEISGYEKPNLGEIDRSLLFKIMNTSESSAHKIVSHFKIKRLSSQYKSEFPVMRRLQEFRLIKEIQQQSFLHDSIYYKLTPYGLFYIFSNTMNYSPQLLRDNQDSLILKTLLFQYLQSTTVRQCTGRFYATITQYLNDCCSITLNALSNFKSLDDRQLGLRKIEHDLRREAKILGIKLTIMYNESNLLTGNPDITDENARLSLYELESTMKTILSKDSRFLEFLGIIHSEISEAFAGF